MSLQVPPAAQGPVTAPHSAPGNLPAVPGGNPLAGVGTPVFDIWGPLQRRKYLVALFCIIGLALGYLYYSRTPKVYSSSCRLMISTQAPPSFVDGDLRLDKVSLSKQASLIASDLVLQTATDDGQLAGLDMFQDVGNVVSELKRTITIESEADDVLTISFSGSHSEDLPKVLHQVILAYQMEIEKDSRAIGEETVEMIEKLKEEFETEQSKDVAEKDQLWQELGIKQLDSFGNVINPHDQRLLTLEQEISRLRRDLNETEDRQRLLAESLKMDEQTGLIDPIQIKVAAVEAQEYLKLERAIYKEAQMNDQRSRPQTALEENRQRTILEQRLFSVETKINELRFERRKLSEVFGKGHKSMSALDEQIAFYEEQKQKLEAEDAQLMRAINDAEAQAAAAREDGMQEIAAEPSLEEFRSKEDREWITMYQKALEKEQNRLRSTLTSLDREFQELSIKSNDASNKIIRLNTLQNEIDKRDQAVNVILDRLKEMDVLSENYTTTKVKVLDLPKNGKVIAPSLPKSLALGGMLAFLVGLGFAILVDRSEFAYHSPAEIFERLQVPVIGKIPRINVRQIEPEKGHASLVAAHKPAATASESFRDVRTALFFRANIDNIKTILFTSPSPGDGKSTTVANLAISIAQAGKRVILVDADFRRPRVHQYFGQEMNPGLLDVLSGEKALKDAIQPAELQENLYLLPAGGRPGNPGELVTSEAFRNLVQALRDKFDYVLIDSPPVLPVSDPATIASMVDGVFLVTRIRKGVKLTSQRAKETLDRVGANWMGVIVNGLDENPHYSEYGYQYGSYSYYGGVYGRYYDSSRTYRDKLEAGQKG